MEEETKNRVNPKYVWFFLAMAGAGAILFLIFLFAKKVSSPPPVSEKIPVKIQKEKIAEVKKFSSEREFKDYLEKAKNISGFLGGRGGGTPLEMKASEGAELPEASLPQTPRMGGEPSRVSETNVQVAGIDEPDLVKTDGKEIYFSPSWPEIMPLDNAVESSADSKEPWPLRQKGATKAIKAFPPDELKIDAKIDKNGDLLLVGPTAGETGKILVVISSQRYYWTKTANKIYGFDISDPEKPKEVWSMEIKDSSSIVGARLYKGKIYLAMKTDFSDNPSCLIEPLIIQNSPFSVKCTDIYHPTTVVPAEAAYTALAIDPVSGKVEKSVSFVGSSDYTSSVVYMSPEALYVTYYYPGDFVKAQTSFFSENKGLVPDWLVQKLKNLENYDISSSAKMTEFWELLGRYQNSLSNDDRLKFENEIADRMGDYLAKHRRELDSTGIVKINIDNLDVAAAGSVPGKLLNQFSLDEYKGDLRLATTVGENFWGGWGWRRGRSSESANDVYILGDDMKIEGSVIDLGKGERIYAVRFIEDKGYVVTFRQMDPFYILDLADPVNPEKKGELKIPGYSSYLHPITKDKILGIGEEDNKVKVSLFDVSDPANPTEIAKYNLDEYWSEISQTHHAFLLDTKHEIFFFPGSKGGYVFSYTGDNLKLEKTVADTQIKRAIYINDYLYVIGEDRLVVLDEKNWEKVGELEL